MLLAIWRLMFRILNSLNKRFDSVDRQLRDIRTKQDEILELLTPEPAVKIELKAGAVEEQQP